MKKIDLHIHTIATESDAAFTFNINKFQEFVDSLSIDVVAITNHNVFDKDQFTEIKSTLRNVTVFPGIEINIGNGHLLLIAKGGNVVDFDNKCKIVSDEFNSSGQLTLDKMKEIFPDLSDYLLIPHYDKSPMVRQEVISSFCEDIYAGEVQSPKKFYRIIKEEKALTPVLFSDARISETLSVEECQGKQTFIKTNASTITLDIVKAALRDKQKVFLSSRENHDFFQVFTNGQELSHGLNIVLGGRSSGKTHFLNQLEKTYGFREKGIKYIKQGALIKIDEKRFNEMVDKERSATIEKYLKEFRQVVDDVLEIDRYKTNHCLREYVESLLEYASSESLQDQYSKAVLFRDTPFQIQKEDEKDLLGLIKAINIILTNEIYRDIIFSYLTEKNLNELRDDLKVQYKKKAEDSLKKEWVNEVISEIRKDLSNKSACSGIANNDISFYDIKIEREKLKRFNAIVKSIKQKKTIDDKLLFDKFTIQADAGPYKSTEELHAESRRNLSFKEAYKKYNSPVSFLEHLKNMPSLPKSELYKYFCKVRYKVLNQYGKAVSGGERAEFNLLKALEDAQQYEMLLVDEPESSFDNLFLKDNVNEAIKGISASLPVVVVTHNNTVGMLMHPDYILYTERKIIGGSDDQYYIYSGSQGDKHFQTVDGSRRVESHATLLDSLEAGEEAYKCRERLYGEFEE